MLSFCKYDFLGQLVIVFFRVFDTHFTKEHPQNMKKTVSFYKHSCNCDTGVPQKFFLA